MSEEGNDRVVAIKKFITEKFHEHFSSNFIDPDNPDKVLPTFASPEIRYPMPDIGVRKQGI